ncbi:MAG: trypsin-like peptidase domain-containing protein [Clostridia bacterium]|nr:trypsin-like peptidase domain-containing protein [Clostridia bacterium]
MSRKIIPYPCDYQNTTSVRRARRGGNAIVIILCVLIALLLGAGTFFALTNNGQGWNTLMDFTSRYAVCPYACDAENAQPAAEAQTPADKTAPSDAVTPSDEPSQPASQPVVPPDPNLEEHLAQPFDLSGFESIPDVVDAVSPGVIGVLNYQKIKGVRGEPKLAGSGSGFIYSDNGYIITNHHVVEGATLIRVSLKNGDLYDATLVGSDVMTDVAVLKIEAEGLSPLPIGDSSKVRVGEFVLAIGDPISADELSGSVTFGIISALSRQIAIDGFENEYLQTDAAVNPGNSGGPLINMRGEVIGVTSAKYTSAGVDEFGQNISSEGIGFALPINNVMEIATSLIQNGSTVRPGIGITVTTVVEDESDAQGSIVIYSVSEDGPADAAGAKAGDKILKIDGKELASQDEFIMVVRAKKPGDTIVLTVERDGQQLDLTIVVGDLNEIHR